MGLLQSQKNQAKDAFGEDDLEGGFWTSKFSPVAMHVYVPFWALLRLESASFTLTEVGEAFTVEEQEEKEQLLDEVIESEII